MIDGLVSTIIPVYNRGEMLGQAVRSVTEQSYRPIEIIIVDDGSTDETPRIADQLKQGCPSEIRVLHIPNCGPGLAREAGKQAARGEFIQYLDSDDLLLPRKFDVQVAALNSHAECGIAYGYTRLVDHDGAVLRVPYKWTGRTMDSLFPSLLVDRWWSTHTPLWRKSVCDKVGPWSDMIISEDWEYEARAAALNVKLVHCHEVLSDARRHAGARLAGGMLDARKQRDMCRLILMLYVCAGQAKVSRDCPEMAHFSRWAFSVARKAGAAGFTDYARQCFEVARSAAGSRRSKKIDFRFYSVLSMLVGWNASGKISGLAEAAFRRKAGPDTLLQSWMEEEQT